MLALAYRVLQVSSMKGKGKSLMPTLTYHVVLKTGFQTEEVMRRVALLAGLENLNERRARIFEFSVITGQAGPGARQILEGMPEVKAVQLDGEKQILASPPKS